MIHSTSLLESVFFINVSSVVSSCAYAVIILLPSSSLYCIGMTLFNCASLSAALSSNTSATPKVYLIVSMLFCLDTTKSVFFIETSLILYYTCPLAFYLILKINSSSPSLIIESCVSISSTPSSTILPFTYVWFVDLLSFIKHTPSFCNITAC